MDTLSIGYQAERQACLFLEKKGFKLLEKNYSCHKMGEIDLIMQDGDTTVFIEVRQRGLNDYVTPLESITPAKQHKIIKAATQYLLERGLYDKIFCRFDVIAISDGELEWVKDAFRA